MTGLILLVIGLVVYAAPAEYVHRRLFSGYRKQTGSLVRALNPQRRRTHWFYVIVSRCFSVGVVLAAVYVAGRLGSWRHPLPFGAAMGIAFVLLWAVETAAGWAFGFYPVRDGFRARYIVEHVPLRTLLADLALSLPAVGLLCALLALWPQS